MNDKDYEEKLKAYVKDGDIQCEHLAFERSCHSVEDAARAMNAAPDQFVKSICMIGPDNGLIVAIVKGEDRASTKRVAKALKIERPRIASPEEILERTGYPCGGTPAFGFDARFLIDPNVMEMQSVYCGGGSERSLVKISPSEIKKANGGTVVRVRK
jgi:prolyl-tRNA editing enzyme YbaK/EbsC (Cys-tRNA(Pro) deacylase)